MTVIKYLVAVGFLVTCAGAGLLRPASTTSLVVRGILVLSGASLVAFFAALLHVGWISVLITAVTVGLGVAGWIVALARYRRRRPPAQEIRGNLVLAGILLCLASLPLLALYTSANTQDPFAAVQGQLGLPNDNALPAMLAEAAESGAYPRPMVEDWLGSDRPPLQSGFIVLGHPVLSLMGQARAAFMVSVAAQQMWLVGGALVVVAVFQRRDVIGAALTTAALTGAALVNGIFTWPKLLSAGLMLACASACVRTLRAEARTGVRARASWLAAGALGGLAAQAHGVAMFALAAVAIVLSVLPRRLLVRPRFVAPTLLLLAAGAVQLPWMAWQRWGDPPGDRLLKYHLAGVTQVDTRPFLQTLSDSYASLGWSGTVAYKLDNLANLVSVPTLPLSPFTSLAAPEAARGADFYSVLAAVSWVMPLLATALLFAAVTRRRPRPFGPTAVWFLVWVGATALIWCLLMFGPATTVNHQGPYTLSLVPLLLAGGWVAGLGRWPWLVGTLVQGVVFVWLYGLAPNMTVHQTTPRSSIAAGLCLVAAVGLSASRLVAPAAPGPSGLCGPTYRAGVSRASWARGGSPKTPSRA